MHPTGNFRNCVKVDVCKSEGTPEILPTNYTFTVTISIIEASGRKCPVLPQP